MYGLVFERGLSQARLWLRRASGLSGAGLGQDVEVLYALEWICACLLSGPGFPLL